MEFEEGKKDLSSKGLFPLLKTQPLYQKGGLKRSPFCLRSSGVGYVEKSFKASNDFCAAGFGDVFSAGGVYQFSDPLAFDDNAADGVSRVEYPGYEVAEIPFHCIAGKFSYRGKLLLCSKISHRQ